MIPRTRRPFSAPKRSKPLRKTGKLGTVRVTGIEMTKLRSEAYFAANGFCQECGIFAPWKSGELAHKRTKRNNGDLPSNVRWLCSGCHFKEHAYGKSGKKPCPPKPLTASGAESTPQQE